MTESTNRDENAESLDFCPHCGAKVLMAQNALMATELGLMGRVKKVDPVVLILHERGLDMVSLSSYEWTTFEAKDIKAARFRPRAVTAKLPLLPDESWEEVGDVLQKFDNMLKSRHWSHRLKQGTLPLWSPSHLRQIRILCQRLWLPLFCPGTSSLLLLFVISQEWVFAQPASP